MIINNLKIENDLVYINNQLTSKRYINNKIIDYDGKSDTFYIDNNGIKHVIQLDNWQALSCNFNDKLLFDQIENTWKVYTKDDLIKKETTDWIYKYYPQDKQNSDFNDKIYYEAWLNSQNYPDLDADVVRRITEIITENKTLDEVTSDITDESTKTAIQQLIKVAWRQNWVNNCKIALTKALDNIEPLSLPAYRQI